MSSYLPENIQLALEIAKLEVLHQCVTGGRASFDDDEPNNGNYWTISAWHNFCTNVRDKLEEFGCSDEEIGSLIQEASDKVHLEDETISYSGRSNLE